MNHQCKFTMHRTIHVSLSGCENQLFQTVTYFLNRLRLPGMLTLQPIEFVITTRLETCVNRDPLGGNEQMSSSQGLMSLTRQSVFHSWGCQSVPVCYMYLQLSFKCHTRIHKSLVLVLMFLWKVFLYLWRTLNSKGKHVEYCPLRNPIFSCSSYNFEENKSSASMNTTKQLMK